MYPSLTAEINASRGSVLGIMDFRYAPYALGDACTWLTKLQIVASRHSLSDIEIMLITLPYKPSSGLQTHITPYNYAQVMDGLLPAFLCCRNLEVHPDLRTQAQGPTPVAGRNGHPNPDLAQPPFTRA